MHLSDEPYFYLFQTQKFSREEKEKFLREYASEGHDNGAEMLLDLIRRLDNGNKITILCNLINYRVNEDISMTDFMRLTSSLERVPITDLRFLNNYTSENNINGVNDSLLSAGLIYESTVNVGKTPLFRLNYSGYQMLRYGLDNHDVNIPENFPKKTYTGTVLSLSQHDNKKSLCYEIYITRSARASLVRDRVSRRSR